MQKDDDLYTQLGSLIKKRRESLDLTQAELAAKVGLSRTSLTNIECGRQRFMVDQLYKICANLNMPMTQLLNKVESETLATPAYNLDNAPTVTKFLATVGMNMVTK